MIRNGKNLLVQALILSTLAGTVGSLASCSSKKNEETTNSSTDTSMGFMGRQGDTTGSDPMMGQQAPPDSASAGGDTAISEVKVTPKK
ncbi:hypothetical protein [Spirosoma rhododendri]|uniref:Coproporphyrinogen III oxidase n=1 Tax=Spirosoma rhododendri TaxID=2728024 RepID=A0A7L5DJ64_9BACT|nr:hypothetical protein [Spirosoma rhododendri]QJD78449.1 hypothetical protein HH216_08445 [Spirosoma rhododendri]